MSQSVLFPVREVKVSLCLGGEPLPVGRLALHERAIYFEYDRSFLEWGLDISPLHLPLKSGISRFDAGLFEGLPGVFNDSLPDGWGRLLFDRYSRAKGHIPSEMTPLDRLVHVGRHGMGALIYEPDGSETDMQGPIDLDHLAQCTEDILEGSSDIVLEELLALNGSSAGARPKAMIGLGESQDQVIHGVHDLPAAYTAWMVKFAGSQDNKDAGAVEYVYALMARQAGICVPEVALLPAKKGPGYFAIKRFDREGARRYHMHSACGLLHSDFRTPSLDYEDLIALTGMLTRDIGEVEKLYRLAVFNVLAHNRDDHAKNFSFLMDEKGQWRLSPAYDLTFSSGPRGEQSSMVMGEGKNPGVAHLIQLGKNANLSHDQIQEIITQTQDSLAQWPLLAKDYGVSNAHIQHIASAINKQSDI